MEQAEPAEAGSDRTKDERPLGEFEQLIIDVAELFQEAKRMEKDKKEQCDSEAAEAAHRDELMQNESVKRKYGGISEEELTGPRKARKAAREAREREEASATSSSTGTDGKKRMKRIKVTDFCEKNEGWYYDNIILGGSNVPKGYTLLSPEDDHLLEEYYLQEQRSYDNVASFRERMAENFDLLRAVRAERTQLELSKEQTRKAEREKELLLEERRVALQEAKEKRDEAREKREEAKEKRDAKKERLMMKLMMKFASKIEANSSDSERGASSDEK